MPIFKRTILFLPALFFALFFLTGIDNSHAAAPEKACKKKILPFQTRISSVSQLGGTWTLFERNRELREHSVKALKLDQKVNELLTFLNYVCESLNGIPFSELATYINRFLETKSEKEVRKEFKIHGKSAEEIDTWFKYTRFFNAHKDRTLDPNSVETTIEKSEKYFDRYVSFSEHLKNSDSEQSLEEAKQIIQDIDAFFEKNEILAQAIFENAQEPFWDIDENYGGS